MANCAKVSKVRCICEEELTETNQNLAISKYTETCLKISHFKLVRSTFRFTFVSRLR